MYVSIQSLAVAQVGMKPLNVSIQVCMYRYLLMSIDTHPGVSIQSLTVAYMWSKPSCVSIQRYVYRYRLLSIDTQITVSIQEVITATFLSYVSIPLVMYRYRGAGTTLVKASTAIFLHQMFPMARIIIKTINKLLQHL